MGKTRSQIVEWESRWMVPVAVAAFLGVALLIVAQVVSPASGDGDAEILRSLEADSGGVALSGIIRALGFVLMVPPLVFLFRAAQARSDRVRGQLIGLVVVAPLFLGVSACLTIGAQNDAADAFVGGEAKSTLSRADAKEDCIGNRKDEGKEDFAETYEPAAGEPALAACQQREIEDDEASNALRDASLAPVVSGFGFAGGLGLLVAFFYTGLWAMRTGLLTRFWGSLAMVAGFAFLLGPIFVVTMIWLIYFGFLCLGLLPGGRPPAWAAGEAVPWPTPGEKAAAELEPEGGEPLGAPEPDSGDGGPGERRKRKRRE